MHVMHWMHWKPPAPKRTAAPRLLAILAGLSLVGCGAVPTDARMLEEAPPSNEATLTLTNVSREDIVHAFIRTTDDVDWGADLLEGEALHPGDALTLDALTAGTYDFRVEDRSGHWKEWLEVELVEGRTYARDITYENWNATQ